MSDTFSTDRVTSAPKIVDKHMGKTFDKMLFDKLNDADENLMDIDYPDETQRSA